MGANGFNDIGNATKVPNSADKLPDNAVSENNFITTVKAAELLGVKQRRARAILQNMMNAKYLSKKGAARSTIYVKNTHF